MTSDHDALVEILSRAKAVLFDFDGPICSVFSGLRAHDVARDLREFLRADGHEISAAIKEEGDPLEVLRYSERFGSDVVRRVDDLLIESELAAVLVAEPTPGGAECLRACASSGRPAAIVTNNSEPAVRHYLARHRLVGLVSVVSGRAYGEPHRMKPNPEPLRLAVADMSTDPAAAVLVGDSVSDIDACRAIGAMAIGYINKPEKRMLLDSADTTLDSMSALATSIGEVSLGWGYRD